MKSSPRRINRDHSGGGGNRQILPRPRPARLYDHKKNRLKNQMEMKRGELTNNLTGRPVTPRSHQILSPTKGFLFAEISAIPINEQLPSVLTPDNAVFQGQRSIIFILVLNIDVFSEANRQHPPRSGRVASHVISRVYPTRILRRHL
jgi:hypothetical protein